MRQTYRRTGKERLQENAVLNAAAAFTNNRLELKEMYLTFVRSILEKSAMVWHSSMSIILK